MRNMEIKKEAREQGVRMWQIAEMMEVSEATITRKFRKELTDTEKTEIRGLIDRSAKQNRQIQ